MKALLVIVVLASLVSSCGDLNPTMAPSVTTVGCAIQLSGSTVSILDAKPSC